MPTDDVRAKLQRAGLEWARASASQPVPLVDALLPVVREALAAEWDAGYRSANPTVPQARRDVVNPWKQGQ